MQVDELVSNKSSGLNFCRLVCSVDDVTSRKVTNKRGGGSF